MFIVKKNIHGKDYYYLRESQRDKETGKVKAKTIAYLGKNKKQAEQKMQEFKNKDSDKKIMKEKTEKKTEQEKTQKKQITIEDMANFCKRKGFVYASAEIYGGLAGFWDFGHLGVELSNNIKKEWWKSHVQQREDIVGIDGSIITNPKVWEASGHVEGFNVNDLLVICKKCKKSNKVEKYELKKIKCECGGEYGWSKAQTIEQMFKTKVGVNGFAYLRPETAQLIFTNFKAVFDNARMKLPFGIAQIGKAFRNEVAPRDFLFRTREFEQMEIEYFVDPNEKCPYEIGDTEVLIYSEEIQNKNKEPEKMKIKDAFKKQIIKTDWHAYWLEQELLWFANLGANPDKFRLRQHVKDEKSHYALDTWDLEYKFPFGWKELQGLANRTDFDLKQHQEFSKQNLEIINEKGDKILPHVVCEPSQGVGRAFLVFMFDSYTYDEKRQNIVLKLHPNLSPVKAAILPLVKNDKKIIKTAKDIYLDLKQDLNVVYDETGSVGRRYSRNDEIGTPFCITIDNDTIKDNSVTLRDRDTTEQIRIKIKDLNEVIQKAIKGENIIKLGKKVNTRVK